MNPRLLIFIGGAIAFPCFYLSSIMSSFTGFAIFFICAFAINQGFTYMVGMHHGWLWFPNNPGLVSGIIIGGFGCGGLIFDNMFTHLINPDNLPINKDGPNAGFYDESINDRFIKTYRIIIACWLAIDVIAFIMIFPGPVPKKKVVGEVDTDSFVDRDSINPHMHEEYEELVNKSNS